MRQKGFTLIELIAVIVILGILAVVAVPQFLDLRADARQAASAGIGGALASATAMNYAKGLARPATAVVITACTGANSAVSNVATLLGGTWSAADTNTTISNDGGTTKYLVAAVSGSAATSGNTAICSIERNDFSATDTAQNFPITGCANTSCT